MHGGLPDLPPLVATHAYRIAAEALTNAVRHSGATRIDVELSADRAHASLVVRDDGGGLPDADRPGSHGLPSMRNRAETIGADLDLSPGARRPRHGRDPRRSPDHRHGGRHMIRILLVDDHPALRAGLTAVLRAEPGLVPLGTAADEEELWPALHRTKPDVVDPRLPRAARRRPAAVPAHQALDPRARRCCSTAPTRTRRS